MDTLLSHVFTVNADYVICTRKDEIPVRPSHIRYLCRILGINPNPAYFFGNGGTSEDVKRAKEVFGFGTYFCPPADFSRISTPQGDIRRAFPKSRRYVSQVSASMIPFAKGDAAKHGFGFLQMLRVQREEKTGKFAHLNAVAFASGIPPEQLWIEMSRMIVHQRTKSNSFTPDNFSVAGYEQFCEMGTTVQGVSYEEALTRWLDASFPVLEGLAYSAIVQMQSHHLIALTSAENVMRLICYNPTILWRRRYKFDLPFKCWTTLTADTIKEIQESLREVYIPAGFYSNAMIPLKQACSEDERDRLRKALALRGRKLTPDLNGSWALPLCLLSWCGIRKFPLRGMDFDLYSPPKMKHLEMDIGKVYTSRCEGGVNFITKDGKEYRDYQILQSFNGEYGPRADVEALLWMLRQSEADLWQI